MGFPYAVNAQAVNFYLGHAHDLFDLPPRRLELIARAFANPVQGARDAELRSMLSKRGDLRPKLKLPAPWITVTDGVPHGDLVWPDEPPSRKAPPSAPEPPPEPDKPDPEPPAAADQSSLSRPWSRNPSQPLYLMPPSCCSSPLPSHRLCPA
jgi:hypothetical protein